jgi:hypothetical protein
MNGKEKPYTISKKKEWDEENGRIESRDKYLFDAGMISEQAMACTLYMIKELTDKLDAYGVEPS